MVINRQMYKWVNKYLGAVLAQRKFIPGGGKVDDPLSLLRKQKKMSGEGPILSQEVSQSQKEGASSDKVIQINQRKKASLTSENEELEKIASDLPAADDYRSDGDFHLVYRSLYAREMLLSTIPTTSKSGTPSDLLVQRFSFLIGHGIKHAEIGGKFTAFLMHNHDLIFLKTSEYFKFNETMGKDKTLLKKITRHNVKYFSTKGHNLVYVSESGVVFLVFYNEEIPSSSFGEAALPFSVGCPVDMIDVSYNYALVTLRDNKDPKLNEEPVVSDGKEESKEAPIVVSAPGKQQTIYAIYLADLPMNDLSLQGRAVKVNGVTSALRSLCIGAFHAYFVTDNGALLGCEIKPQAPQPTQVGTVPVLNPGANPAPNGPVVLPTNVFVSPMFKGDEQRHFQKVYSGFLFYFALEREEVESIEKWDNNQVVAWAEKKEFFDYLKILKYENIKGSDLIKANRSFLTETLGISKENHQTKFLTEICQCIQKTYKNQVLYAWGNNKNGQLGTTVSTNIMTPTKIDLSFLAPDDVIMHIACAHTKTVLTTKKGQLWLSENMPKGSGPKDSEAKTEESAGKDKLIKKEKGPTKPKSDKEKVSISDRWIDITPYFTLLK
jgi:hypothetical protein